MKILSFFGIESFCAGSSFRCSIIHLPQMDFVFELQKIEADCIAAISSDFLILLHNVIAMVERMDEFLDQFFRTF